EQIADEMAAAGVTLTDLTAIGAFVGQHSGIDKEEPKAAEGFSRSEASQQPTSSSGGQPEPGASAPPSSSSSPGKSS
ncbi:unnamed protein product, partial [marine sediment metagenome]